MAKRWTRFSIPTLIVFQVQISLFVYLMSTNAARVPFFVCVFATGLSFLYGEARDRFEPMVYAGTALSLLGLVFAWECVQHFGRYDPGPSRLELELAVRVVDEKSGKPCPGVECISQPFWREDKWVTTDATGRVNLIARFNHPNSRASPLGILQPPKTEFAIPAKKELICFDKANGSFERWRLIDLLESPTKLPL